MSDRSPEITPADIEEQFKQAGGSAILRMMGMELLTILALRLKADEEPLRIQMEEFSQPVKVLFGYDLPQGDETDNVFLLQLVREDASELPAVVPEVQE